VNGAAMVVRKVPMFTLLMHLPTRTMPVRAETPLL
jgi:hypothetical protein